MSSWPPKKYWNIGSLAHGEFGARTTRTDEMFTTPLTACAAMPVKSGRPADVVVAGAAMAAAVFPAWLAARSLAERRRPVRTRPARNPQMSSAKPIEARFIGAFSHRTTIDAPSRTALRSKARLDD